MPREATLPPIFAWLQRQVRFVQRVSDTEYSASCPQCGGQRHADGEWPDRLRVFCDAKPLCWCRRCGYMRFADQGDTPPDGAMLEQWRADQERREQERKRSAERALENLRHERIAEQYHEALTDYARRYWRTRGIPDGLQDYWQLGWRGDWAFGAHHTASATIPIFAQNWRLLNVKHRLLSPPEGMGKYRYEVSGNGQPLFLAEPEGPLGGHVYAVEGEIKAMVTKIHAGRGLFVGLPGKSVSAEIVGQLQQADRVTLVMDPGAKRDGVALARRIGIPRCWLLVTPVKIDDGILGARLSQREVLTLLSGAVRLSDYVVGKGARGHIAHG